MIPIAYYITGHGYGHAVRSCVVMRSLKQREPEVLFHVRTTTPAWLFEELSFPIACFGQALDVGVVQQDSLHMDLEATQQACEVLQLKAADLVAREISFIQREGIRMIVGDIPPLCFEIAALTGLPSVAIANFSWNWIYRSYLKDFPGFLPLIEQMEAFYSKAQLCLSLPFSGDLSVFPKRAPIPLITRTSGLAQQEARSKYGLPQDGTIALVSFGGLGLQSLMPERLQRALGYFFVVTGGEPFRGGNLAVLPAAQHHYEDLVRAADVVVAKPGYGIVADVISHRVPILYTSRGMFPEYDFLVRALNAWATCEFIPQNDLLAGNIAPYLERLLRKEPNWPSVDLNGAHVAAERIVGLLG